MTRSCVFPSSTHPPSLPVPDAATSGRSGSSPEMVLLDTKAYITDDRSNGTTATASTRDGHVVKVSFWLADPPAVSHLCVHCPALKVTDFVDEPFVVCSEKNIAILLLSFNFPPSDDQGELGFSDFFVYRAHPEHPSLDRLPSPHLRFLDTQEVGLLPCLGDEGDDEFVLAALSPRLNPREYDLHMYVSKTERWSTKLAQLESPPPNSRDALLLHRTDNAITLEGGSMAWVDLWRGALLCNVFEENPVVRYIRFPRPANGNKANSTEKCAQLYRDVTYSDNLLKFIEVEPYKRPDICQGLVQPDINVFSDEDYEDDLDTTATRTWYGWRASLWSRKASSTAWYRDFTVDVDEIVISDPTHSGLLPELTVQYPGKSTLQNLVTSSPILSNQGDDVVYLMSRVNFEDEKTWVIGVDMKTKTLRGVASFSTDRCVYSRPAYLPCSLSGYLDMTSNSSDAGCNTKGRNDVMNVGNDTTIVVTGLDPCITEDDLRQVFEPFGEVQYVKIFGQNVHLSWGCNTLEQPPQHDVNQWNGDSYYVPLQPPQHDVNQWNGDSYYVPLQPPQHDVNQWNGDNYYDHSHCYGAQRYSSPTVEDPDVRAYGTSPYYSNNQEQPLAQQNISQWNGGSHQFYTQAYGRCQFRPECQYCWPAIQNPNVYAHCTYPAGYGNYQQQQKLPPVQHVPSRLWQLSAAATTTSAAQLPPKQCVRKGQGQQSPMETRR